MLIGDEIQNLAQQKEVALNLPPMLQQYLDFKQKYPDCLLFFQVGDFYEAFFQDAIELSRALNLTLTSRDKNSEQPIPMCGVPISVVDNYLERLLAQDFSVAIVSQVGVAGKGAVPRQLERIVTPAIRVLGNTEGSEDQTIAGIYFTIANDQQQTIGHTFALAYSYAVSDQINLIENLDRESLILKLAQVMPKELVLPDRINGRRLDRRFALIRELERRNPGLIIRFRNPEVGKVEVNEISGFVSLDANGKSAARLLLGYVDEVMVSRGSCFRSIKHDQQEKQLLIDASTRNNLDLLVNQRTGRPEGSLLAYLDHTCTAGGRRLLRRWVLAPSLNLESLAERHQTVAEMLDSPQLSEQLRKQLSQVGDLERLAVRIELDAISPLEMGVIRDTLILIQQIASSLSQSVLENYTGYWKEFIQQLDFPTEFLNILADRLLAEPARSRNEGGIFQAAFHPQIAHWRQLQTNGQDLIRNLEEQEREASQISSLKIKFNNLQGYFFEVTKSNIDKVPSYFIRKQSTVNTERYYTPELKKLEEDLVNADGELFKLERELFKQLCVEARAFVGSLRAIYQRVAKLDVLLSFSELSRREDLVRPLLNSDQNLEIDCGRHPVLSQLLKNDFVPNNLTISKDQNCLILTGPNMGGKTTFLRQAALIVIMAQIGCFVPAQTAQIGLVDRIFARIGASDDLMEGDSTFMLEMREAAEIIRCATTKSLILVDELGRGTSTTDGCAVAQAVLEWIAKHIQARTIFATHFHQLTELANVLPCIKNISVGSVDLEGQVLFTHEIVQGPANNSYGLEVARMAGLPDTLLERAATIVLNSPKVETNNIQPSSSQQMTLFQASRPSIADQKLSEIRTLLDLDPNNLTPRSALDLVYKLIENLKNSVSEK